VDVDAVLGGLYELIALQLTEKQRHLLAGAAARALGRGGGARMARISGPHEVRQLVRVFTLTGSPGDCGSGSRIPSWRGGSLSSYPAASTPPAAAGAAAVAAVATVAAGATAMAAVTAAAVTVTAAAEGSVWCAAAPRAGANGAHGDGGSGRVLWPWPRPGAGRWRLGR
jgi:hypothetical protein